MAKFNNSVHNKAQSLEQRVNDSMLKFDKYYVVEVMQKQGVRSPDGASKDKQKNLLGAIDDYLRTSHSGIYQELQKQSEQDGMDITELLYHLLKDPLKERYKPILLPAYARYSDSERFNEERSAQHFVRYVEPLPELKEFRRNIAPFLNQEQFDKIASKLSKVLYERLNERQRKLLSTNVITKHLLGLGYLSFTRPSHKQALGFIKEYSALFQDTYEVISSIMERYVDEELARTPIKSTEKKIDELKNWARNMAKGELA